MTPRHPILPAGRTSPLDELVIDRPWFGFKSFYADPDRAELFDAVNEIDCGCLPGRCRHDAHVRELTH